MKQRWFVLAVCLLASLSAHAQCGSTSPTGSDPRVCGAVWTWTQNGWVGPQTSFTVKFCQTAFPNNCVSAFTSLNPALYSPPRQAYVFYNWYYGSTQTQWDVYAWDNSTYYGSSTQPLERKWISGLGQSGVSLYVPPQALPPTPVYPGNGTANHIYGNYPVIWKSGLDGGRAVYPVTYEVWFKYWPFGAAEPANYSLSAANLPCHADGSGPDEDGNCNTTVAGAAPEGNWRWKVIADLNVTQSLGAGMPTTIYKTESASAFFTWIP